MTCCTSNVNPPTRFRGYDGTEWLFVARIIYAQVSSNGVSGENKSKGTIWVTNWYEASVIPAKAGIHPLPPLETVSQLSFRGEAEKSLLRMRLKTRDPSLRSG